MPRPTAQSAPNAPTQPDPTPADEAALRSLFVQEQALLAARRRLALPRPEGETGDGEANDSRLALPRVGLAISGGGVRSATFGLGLLRGLAQQGLLGRIDYLSTVSGGGFIGALFGRMVAALGIGPAQAVLARATSPALDWLRRNGRYLTPAGSRDIGIAVVTYLRAIIVIHGESALACLPFVLLVVTPHLLLQGITTFDPGAWANWHTLWWPLALLAWLLGAPGAMTAYWVARDTPDPNLVRPPMPWRDRVFLVVFALVVLLASATAAHNLTWAAIAAGQSYALLVIGANVGLWSCLAGLIYTPVRLRASAEKRALAVARLRNGLTRALRVISLGAAAMALVGALDVTSWWLLEALQSGENWVWGGVGLGGLGVVLMRTLVQPLQQLAEQAKAGASPDLGPKLLNAAGLLGMVALLLAWLVLVQWLLFAPEPLAAVRDYSPGLRALGLVLIAALWWGLLARNEQMANASSLHSFYRARLTRAYLAVGNPARGILADSAEPTHTDVTEVVPGDDLDLRDYRPEAQGGPIHLVNACLNQTRDDASGLYNADRKGTLVTATARAFEVGPREAVALGAGEAGIAEAGDVGTLGRWVAVSGAAASPGAGSYTSAGWALLLFFLGIRLGYWARAPKAPAGGWPVGMLNRWRRAAKPLMLWSEVAASFHGRARPWWYLSDGGHFENTGVYALLKRRLDFIILADNSADGDYRFGDLENLVRKARIDFGAEIEFYTRAEAASHFSADDAGITVLSPEDMADNHSARGVLLARVRYAAAADGARAEATLLVVKPNLHDALDLDLLAYARRHPTFPHESTGDQSFDEAQWESYQRLGEDFGRGLQPAWLARLPGWSQRAAHPMTIAARLKKVDAVPAAAATEPLWRRTARATALGATLGLGASGTLLLGLWQVSEQLRQSAAAEQTEAQRLFTDVSKELRDFDGACPKVADHTAVQLMMLRDLRQGTRLRPLEREGVAQLIDHVRDECDEPPSRSLDCEDAVRRAQAGICAVVNKPPSEGTALSYWHSTPTRVTLASVFGSGVPDVRVAGGPQVVPSAPAPSPATVPDAAGSPPTTLPAAPPKLTTRGDVDAASAPPAEPASVPAPTPAPPNTGVPAVPAPEVPASACQRDGGPLKFYVQIYDEASRPAAAAVVRALQGEVGEALRIAPVENVARAAALRDQRRPVPWPQPTLIVHNPADRPCAAQLAKVIGAALPAVPGRDGSVWVRDLPRSLKAQSSVIELWIPPRDQVAGAAQ